MSWLLRTKILTKFFKRTYSVNIRNVFKWFKRLQNIFKTYLNPFLWFSKPFQVNIYAVMFEKNVLETFSIQTFLLKTFFKHL